MSRARFFIAAAAGAVFGVWVLCLLLAFGDAGLGLDGSQQGVFVPGYFLMIYGPPIMVALLSYLALRKNKQL
jgi:hypothetical protein